MYSQANMYGQPAYGGHPFPPAPMYHYPQPPSAPVPQPPPVFHVDPNRFRKDYLSHLSQLTFNSRPIIQNLSMLAQDYSRYADIVVSCVELHIRRVHPSIKLPAFYLLDAISKNVYEPYARCFASVVAALFLETYSQVDEQTRNKMEEMLLTWRTGSPTHGELFGPVTQISIERGVWGDGGSISITKAQVLSELQFAIGQKERALQINPYDADAQRKIEVMLQLRRFITDVGVSTEELRQILQQLRELDKGAPQAAPQSSPPAGWQPAPVYPATSPPPRPQVSLPHYPPNHNTYPSTNYHTSPVPPPPAPVQSTSAAVPSLPDTQNITNLLNTLLSAGVVSSASSVSTNISSGEAPPTPDAGRDVFREYRNAILAHKSTLSSSDILRTKPQVASFIYGRLPSQCKQCGLRFSDSALGKKTMQEHLDMHFRQNRKSTQNTGRGHCRTWFVDVDDWIRDVSGNDKGKGRADSASMKKSGTTIKSEAELRAQFVIVPAGDEAKHISCPICKESLKSEFLEDDEEWVWKNAVMKDDKIYHATCHAEALSSTSSLAARLRNEATSSSRGATPEVASSRSTPPPLNLRKSKSPSPDSKLVGVKRKVEHRDSELTEEATGTPPMKKMALSTAAS